MKFASPLSLISQAMKVYENPETIEQLKADLRIGTSAGSQIPGDLLPPAGKNTAHAGLLPAGLFAEQMGPPDHFLHRMARDKFRE